MKNKCKTKVQYRVENIVTTEEIACYKQYLLFSQSFRQLYILSMSKYGLTAVITFCY